ncbi:hypothetical protein BFL38_00450 [Brachyspira hampsonii]|uniref:Uncharacterized protein n=1 Tax=Brachyspira hampsonii TaxID=1287055 RepID=A0A1E5NAD9_9SPIR|nr:hypothetical protein [Brachyspira hampsonii]OEJ13071.1 hypothetical protein BFL38_00450 [Brachyspira hampsonii]
MREVLTLLPKLSNEGFESLKQETLAFSKELGKVPEEVVPALYQSLSAGVPRENVFEFLKTAGELTNQDELSMLLILNTLKDYSIDIKD